MATKSNNRNLILLTAIALIVACGYPKEEGQTDKEITIDSMHSYLSTLDYRLAEASGSALSYTLTIMQTMAEDRRDSAFILYRQFFYEVLMKQNEVLSQNERLVQALAERQEQEISEVEYFRKKLNENGMVILQSEGIFYVDEKHDYLYDAFSKYVTVPIKKLLELKKEEMKKGFSEDAALLISFKEVGERVRNWEKLIEENPSLKLQQEAEGYYNLYLSTFLTGLDNTPVFNFQTNELLHEVKEAYEDYIKSNENVPSGQILNRYYSLLEKNNFKRPADLNTFLAENNLKNMSGVQPPTR